MKETNRMEYIRIALKFMDVNGVKYERRLLETVFFLGDERTLNYMQYERWR